MIRAKVSFTPVLLLLASGGMVYGQNTIYFDDVPVSGAYSTGKINNGYNNLNWNNFYATDGLDLSPAYLSQSPLPNPAIVNGGFYADVMSGKNVALNAGGSPAYITGTSSGAVFDLISAYFTAAWYSGVNLEIQGYHNGSMVYDNNYTLSPTTPMLITMDYNAVDEVKFLTTGGTPYAPYNNSLGGPGFAMDNLTVDNPSTASVPDAAPSCLLFGASLATLAWFRRKRRLTQQAVAISPARKA